MKHRLLGEESLCFGNSLYVELKLLSSDYQSVFIIMGDA